MRHAMTFTWTVKLDVAHVQLSWRLDPAGGVVMLRPRGAERKV